MNPFSKFVASSTGRITRIIAGIVLVDPDLLFVQGVGGIVVAVIGLARW